MVEKELTIINKLGLHARAAAKLVNVARSYESTILINVGEKSARADSIMGLMTLCATKGTDISVSAEGEDEELALAAVDTLINNRFDEPD